MKLVADCANSFNVGKNMTANQIYETSELILKDFNDLKIPDIQLAFNRAKSGRYGTTYDRVDCSVLMSWISQYDFERQEEISQSRINEASKLKVKVPMMDERVTERIKEILKKEPVQEKKIAADEQSVLFNKFYRQFDKCFLKWGCDFGGKRFVKRYGKNMDGLEFVEYKFEQLKKIKAK